jgi:flagellar motility protein MotE (MotC chaperone)
MKNAFLSTLFLGFSGLGAINFLSLNAQAASPKSIPSTAISPTNTTVTASSEELCLSPKLVEQIAPRQKAMLEREAVLESRESELKALENMLKDRVASLEASRAALQAVSDKIDASAAEDITHLIKMYSSMKPKKAASIFDKMDPAFAAGFLREIDGARAGLILSEMNVQQSYKVSLLIANRQSEWRNGTD